MKTSIAKIIGSLLALAQFATAAPPDPLELHRHVVKALQSVHDKFPEPLKKFTETFPLTAIPREGMIALAQVGAPPAAPGDVDAAAIADWANNLATVTTKATLDGIFPRTMPRKPVIVGGSGDAKANAAMEEDLNVMMRILEKSAGGREDGRPTAGGIELFSFGKANAPRVFYIEGYGPMFVLNVRYPLVAPVKEDQTRTNEPTNSEWEKAREEVYGRGKSGNEMRLNAAPAEEFDAARVESLKSQLTEDLLNAKNIRGLKADDSVTVVVLGGAQRGNVMRWETRGPGGRVGAGVGGGGGVVAGMDVREVKTSGGDAAGQSTMILRVKKSDVEKFAKEKQSSEQGKSQKQVSEIVDEFAKKVTVQVY